MMSSIDHLHIEAEIMAVIQRRFNPRVAAYTNQDGVVVDAESARKDVHTEAARDSIEVSGINRVLGAASRLCIKKRKNCCRRHDEH